MGSSAVPARLFWEWHGGGELHKALLMAHHKTQSRAHVKPAAVLKDLCLSELREGGCALSFPLPA